VDATGHAADDFCGRLDHDDELVGRLAHVEHPEAVKSEQCLGEPSTVTHIRGPSVVAVLKQQPRCRDL
jgi:hypothetical protein